MLTIPKSAMPVVLILRRDVKKPKTIGLHYNATYSPRFTDNTCPMGKHPLAKRKTPLSSNTFPCVTTTQIREFYRWWDYLTLEEAYEAVHLIWPKEAV